MSSKDPEFLAAFQAIRDRDLRGHELAHAALALEQNNGIAVYPDCGYQPLNAWFAQAFSQLHAAGEFGAAEMFARTLGPRIDDQLQEALLRATEDESFGPDGTRAVIGEAALRWRPAGSQVEEGVAALTRDLPHQLKTS